MFVNYILLKYENVFLEVLVKYEYSCHACVRAGQAETRGT